MKEFSFNTFFGYENILMEKPEIVLFGAMLLPIGLIMVVSMIGWVFRKLKFNMYIIQAILYTLLFTFFFGAVTMLILFFITDKSGVKLAWCWSAILLGMFCFSIINTNTISKMFTDWSKIIKN
ncbi:ABC-type Fe3+-siderophore transport system permease subunit [Chryseobacterium vietnamense]|uniref:ABC-type Fe3+-siderophore transport system permease subunit n=1 Tax=Chryseobacterium vietnamense TaxID=866785 RepID=A0ACC6J9P9_9FLAO|nr:hypothetical protein [Chryseobacterium vietnamense]MDR6459569.1 ABC-type Fe3+-siderophore transport system permease subunit [Chryseobacterium vietnamense]